MRRFLSGEWAMLLLCRCQVFPERFKTSFFHFPIFRLYISRLALETKRLSAFPSGLKTKMKIKFDNHITSQLFNSVFIVYLVFKTGLKTHITIDKEVKIENTPDSKGNRQSEEIKSLSLNKFQKNRTFAYARNIPFLLVALCTFNKTFFSIYFACYSATLEIQRKQCWQRMEYCKTHPPKKGFIGLNLNFVIFNLWKCFKPLCR